MRTLKTDMIPSTKIVILQNFIEVCIEINNIKISKKEEKNFDYQEKT